MQRYILRRILLAVPTMLLAMTIIFLVMNVLPGDVAMLILGEETQSLDMSQYEALREQMGLNRPLYEQYFSWLGDMVRLDMGTSLRTGNPVWEEIRIRLPYTLTLVVLTMIISIILAIPIGVASALKQDSLLDYGLRSFAILGLSIPSFWFGLLIMLFMINQFRWYPPLEYAPILKDPAIALQQLILPAIVMGYRSTSLNARMMRSSMLEVLREDYVRTARSKGVRERTVIYVHAMRNAILPVVTMFGMEAIFLFGGAVIVEKIFSIPGIGTLLIDAVQSRDVIMVQGVTTLVIAVVLFGNLLVDLLYGWIDPRIRYQ